MPDEQKPQKSRSEMFLDILKDRQKSQGKSDLLNNRQGKFQKIRNQEAGDTDKRGRLKGRLNESSEKSSAVGSNKPAPTAGPPKAPPMRPRF